SVPVKGTRAAPSARPLSGWDQNAGVGAAEQAPLSTPPAEQIALSTQPAEPRAPVGGGVLVAARHAWRRLTSMRTALVLLFLLALAAVPGSLLPQRRLNLAKVAQYRAEHPRLAPLLDRLGFFDVFASPWFAAVYLLLFVSLVGCIVPRV